MGQLGLVSLILFILTFARLGFSATIHIQTVAEVSGSEVTLGEIATIAGSSPKEEKTLGALSLGRFPITSETLVLTSSEISEKLRQYATELQNSQVKIPRQIEMTHKSQEITVTQVQRQIEKVVKNQLPDPAWDFEVSGVLLAPVIQHLKAESFQIIPPFGRAKGVYSFELIASEHRLPRRFWVTAKVQYFCKVAVLTRQIGAHSRFVPTDIQWQRKEVTFMNDIPATPEDASASLARMTLNPGTLLLRSHLEREMALKFGDQVDLILGDDGVAIITKGIAQQNGFVGDSVKVKSMTTNKMLDGVITARGVVNVRY